MLAGPGIRPPAAQTSALVSPFQPVHDAGHVGGRAAHPVEPGRELRVCLRRQRRVPLAGALGDHRRRVVGVHPGATRPPIRAMTMPSLMPVMIDGTAPGSSMVHQICISLAP